MKKLFFLFISLVTGINLFAQKNADWTIEFPSKINWYRISDAGTVLVATKDALYGLSPNGEEVWKADDIENIKEDNLDVLDGTPYITLVKAKLVKSNNKVVDVVSGKTILNTEDLGFHNVVKRLYLPQSNQLLFYGGNKNGKLILALADLATGAKVWEQEKLFEKKSEQLKIESFYRYLVHDFPR